MNPVHVDAVGLAAPGMASWREGAPMLADESGYRAGESPRCTTQLLPANERRRVSATVRLALQVAEEAVRHSCFAMADLSSVFATCDGDTQLIDRICVALAEPERPVSPTQFHNSVHNAAAGYWAIGARSAQPSTTVSAYHASFAAGLLEACAQLAVEAKPMLLVAYDHPAPAPLAAAVGPYPPFAAALVLSPEATSQSIGLRVATVSGEHVDAMASEALERLRVANPAASSLPLLRALAAGENRRVVLPHVNGLQLAVDVESV